MNEQNEFANNEEPVLPVLVRAGEPKSFADIERCFPTPSADCEAVMRKAIREGAKLIAKDCCEAKAELKEESTYIGDDSLVCESLLSADDVMEVFNSINYETDVIGYVAHILNVWPAWCVTLNYGEDSLTINVNPDAEEPVEDDMRDFVRIVGKRAGYIHRQLFSEIPADDVWSMIKRLGGCE